MAVLKVGVVGIGNIGSVHAETIYSGKIEGMTLAALCDTDPEKRQWLKEKYPTVPVFASHTEMLDSGLTDTVIISAPHKFHPPIAEDAFRAGMNVISEKPAGVDVKTVEKMYAEARKSGKTFGIMFNQRTDPLFNKAREIIRDGRLGKPKRLVWIITNWYRSQAYYDSGSWRATWNGEGGGVLLNQAPHNLDVMQWLFGMPQSVRAVCNEGKYHNIPVEDDATLFMEYDGGAVATFITTTGEYPGTNRLEISGDRGKIVIEQGVLRFWSLSEPEREYCFNAEGRPLPTLSEEKYESSEVSGHMLILKNFAAHVLHGEPLIAPGYDGVNELSISNAAYLSSWTGRKISLPFSDEDKEQFLSLLNEKRANEKAVEKTVKEEAKSSSYKKRWQVQW